MENAVASFLWSNGVPYYWPKERIQVWKGEGKDRKRIERVRAILPGLISVGGGQRGRDVLSAWNQRHPGVGMRYIPISEGQQRRYRVELERFAPLVEEGMVRRITDGMSLEKGRPCRVVSGRFQGFTGRFVRVGSQGCFIVDVLFMGAPAETSIPIEDLEIA